jgi:hypothetical protein
MHVPDCGQNVARFFGVLGDFSCGYQQDLQIVSLVGTGFLRKTERMSGNSIINNLPRVYPVC